MIQAVSLLSLLAVAVWTDVREHRIRNSVTLGGSLIAILLQTALHGWGGLGAALAGLAIGYAFFLPGYLLAASGAGDVKLMGMVGAFVGPYGALAASIGAILTGGGFALGLALVRSGSSPWRRYRDMIGASVLSRSLSYAPPEPGEVMARPFPLAPSIALGACAGLWWIDWFEVLL
jgi:prepilin peptidase CpaA